MADAASRARRLGAGSAPTPQACHRLASAHPHRLVRDLPGQGRGLCTASAVVDGRFCRNLRIRTDPTPHHSLYTQCPRRSGARAPARQRLPTALILRLRHAHKPGQQTDGRLSDAPHKTTRIHARRARQTTPPPGSTPEDTTDALWVPDIGWPGRARVGREAGALRTREGRSPGSRRLRRGTGTPRTRGTGRDAPYPRTRSIQARGCSSSSERGIISGPAQAALRPVCPTRSTTARAKAAPVAYCALLASSPASR